MVNINIICYGGSNWVMVEVGVLLVELDDELEML